MQYMISKDNGKLQLPYGEYLTLLEKLEEARRVMQVKSEVLESLQAYLDGRPPAAAKPAETEESVEEAVDETDEVHAAPEKVKVEFDPEPAEAAADCPENTVVQSRPKDGADIPPIKKEIAVHFNALDDSGRLFNVFKQYYTCLNEACGGTVRVTMKDGVFSLWNYDEWEEFAFIDILDANLRFALDPRYTDELSSLSFCEVSRLLASRRNLVAIQLSDLNKTMLTVLTKAFNEVGMTAN